MAMERGNFARRLRLGGAVLLLALTIMGVAPRGLALAAAANPPGLAPVSPGMARIWIYRDYEPYQTLARPYVRLNGAIAGISEPGGALYRDVVPGTYTVTVDSDGTDQRGCGDGELRFARFRLSVDCASRVAAIKTERLRSETHRHEYTRRAVASTRQRAKRNQLTTDNAPSRRRGANIHRL